MILLYDQWVVLTYEGTKAKTPKIKNLATVSDFFCSWCLVRIRTQKFILEFWFLILKIVITKTVSCLFKLLGKMTKRPYPVQRPSSARLKKYIIKGGIYWPQVQGARSSVVLAWSLLMNGRKEMKIGCRQAKTIYTHSLHHCSLLELGAGASPKKGIFREILVISNDPKTSQ